MPKGAFFLLVEMEFKSVADREKAEAAIQAVRDYEARLLREDKEMAEQAIRLAKAEEEKREVAKQLAIEAEEEKKRLAEQAKIDEAAAKEKMLKEKEAKRLAAEARAKEEARAKAEAEARAKAAAAAYSLKLGGFWSAW